MEQRTKFLRYVNIIVDNLYDNKKLTEKQKLETLAFSILSSIDGCAIGIPAFELRPIDEDGKVGDDIAGGLHEHFHQNKVVKHKDDSKVIPEGRCF